MDITFILNNPSVPENIGAVARAIKTMGFKKLRIVNPVDEFMSRARIIAHASNDILENAIIFKSFNKAIEDFDFLIATSSKKRRTNEEYIHSNDLYKLLENKQNHIAKSGIVFGSEESGLSNDEIKRCDIISYIPLIQSYPSLNLSHAVMVYAYLLSGFNKSTIKSIEKKPEGSIKVLKEKVSVILDEIHIKQPHIIGPRIFERISMLKDEDLSLIHSICNAYLEKKRI